MQILDHRDNCITLAPITVLIKRHTLCSLFQSLYLNRLKSLSLPVNALHLYRCSKYSKLMTSKQKTKNEFLNPSPYVNFMDYYLISL